MADRIKRLLDWAARPSPMGGGWNYHAFWNWVPHVDDPEHPEDKNWAESEPDPNAP